METTTLQAEVRDSRGKGPARRLRAQGQIPGVFYGPGVEPTPLTLSPKELEKALRGERGRNVVFKLSVGGKDELAMVKDVTIDPVSRELLHVDLYRIFEDKVLEIDVPFHAIGRAQGVVMGGVLNVTRRTLPLRTTPANIPVSISVVAIILEPRKALAAEEEEGAAGEGEAAAAVEGDAATPES
jgi:large subunit ribosomal protein L25